MKTKIILLLSITIISLGCVKKNLNYKCTCVKYKLNWDGYSDTIKVSTSITSDKKSCYRNDTITINIGDIITICK